jgi:hypothetical protein
MPRDRRCGSQDVSEAARPVLAGLLCWAGFEAEEKPSRAAIPATIFPGTIRHRRQTSSERARFGTGQALQDGLAQQRSESHLRARH